MDAAMELVVLSTLQNRVVAATGKVIKAEDSAQVCSALELLDTAKKIAAQQDMLVREATQKAHARGLQTGRDEASREYSARLARAEAARHVEMRDLKPALVDVVMQAVEAVVRGTDRRHLLSKSVEAVDTLLRQARWARLRVHPSAVEAAKAALADSADLGGVALELVAVVSDTDVGEDGCVFETDVGMADGSLGVQLELLRDAVTAAVNSLEIDRPVPAP